MRQFAEMPADDQPGLLAERGGVVVGGAIDIVDEALCRAYVVDMPEIFLQRLQPLHQGVDLPSMEQAAEKFGHVPKLL